MCNNQICMDEAKKSEVVFPMRKHVCVCMRQMLSLCKLIGHIYPGVSLSCARIKYKWMKQNFRICISLQTDA